MAGDEVLSEDAIRLRRVYEHAIAGALERIERGEAISGAEVVDLLEAHRRITALEQVERVNALTRESGLDAGLGVAETFGLDEDED